MRGERGEGGVVAVGGGVLRFDDVEFSRETSWAPHPRA